MKILFIFDYPIGEREAGRFGFETLRRHGFDLDVWDITPALHPRLARRVNVSDPLRTVNVRSFTSIAAARDSLASQPRDTFLFLAAYYQLGAVSLYRAIGALGLRYGVVVANALPAPPAADGIDTFVARLARMTPRRLLWQAIRRIPYAWLTVPPATLVVAGGEESVASQRTFYPVTPASRIVWTHSFDYDEYLGQAPTSRGTDRQRGVFLDGYLPFHPDFEYLRLPPPTTADAYYPKLRAYFDFLEREHGLRVVIAAHPRSEYERHPDYFGGRAVIRGRTAELVRTSGFVVAHASTALNYAVMFERPVVFITTDQIDASPGLGRYISDLAARFGSPHVNLDRPPGTWQTPQSIDRQAYTRYRAAYIKREGTPERPCWQIVADELERLANA